MLTIVISKEKDEPHAADLLGGMSSNRLDIPLMEKFGKCIDYIEFIALCQKRQICYTTLPIEKQEYPAFPARELSCKCHCMYGRDNLEHKRCVESFFLCTVFRHYLPLPSLLHHVWHSTSPEHIASLEEA